MKFIDVSKDDDPARPCTGGIEHRLDRVFHAVVHLNVRLETFTDVAPEPRDEEPDDSRQDVNDES